jgi:YbbR domain-containing protein
MSWLRTVGLRLALSLGLGFSLWAFVSVSENPEELVTFDEQPVEVRNLSPDLVVVDQNGLPDPAPPEVSVILTIERAQRNSLRSVDILPFVDLLNIGPGDHSVPVEIERVNNRLDFRVAPNGVRPATVPVRIEERVTNTVPISVEIRGQVPFSFEVGEPEVRVNDTFTTTVDVSGPLSRVSRVVAAKIIADVDQLSASYSSSLTLRPVDAAGQLVDGVTLSTLAVTVNIPIQPVVGIKLVPVQVQVTGLPAAGYRVIEIRSDPQLVNITGNSGVLNDVVAVPTEPIDISGARGLVVRDVALLFPDGTLPNRNEPRRAQVTIRVAQVAQVFQVALPVQVELEGVGNGLFSTIAPEVLIFNLTGSSSAIADLGSQTLRASIDVSGLGPGTYSFTPTLALPEGITIVAPSPQVTVTLALPPTVVPRPLPTAPPPATPSAQPTPAPEVPTETPASEAPTTTPEAPISTSEPSTSTPEVAPPSETAPVETPAVPADALPTPTETPTP